MMYFITPLKIFLFLLITFNQNIIYVGDVNEMYNIFGNDIDSL